MESLKTYGGVVQSVIDHVTPIRAAASKEHFGTPSFYKETVLATHRGFESWCVRKDVSDSEMDALRENLIAHVKRSRNIHHSEVFQCLEETLPDEFNVRGQWTPESTGPVRRPGSKP